MCRRFRDIVSLGTQDASLEYFMGINWMTGACGSENAIEVHASHYLPLQDISEDRCGIIDRIALYRSSIWNIASRSCFIAKSLGVNVPLAVTVWPVVNVPITLGWLNCMEQRGGSVVGELSTAMD